MKDINDLHHTTKKLTEKTLAISVSSRERSGNEKTKQNKTIVKDKIVLSQKTFIS